MNLLSDFRSDTVTRPTPTMREAMSTAVVGDDVFGDDPTVNELEARVASLFGHEAALFVPSGTMGNLIGISLHTSPGDEIILEGHAHTYNSEVGGAAAVAGVQVRPLATEDGRVTPERVEPLIRPDNVHLPRTKLISVENTHNFHGGRVIPLSDLTALSEFARDRGIAVHLDGARIWNAAVASGTKLADYGAAADTISTCFSKGIGAPVGSALIGSKELVAEGRRLRKRFGGGMRQVGILAAAVLCALEDWKNRLAEDHRRCRRLADGLRKCDFLEVPEPETNILFVKHREGLKAQSRWAEGLIENGVHPIDIGELGVRWVLHSDLKDEDVERALEEARS